MDRKEFLGGLMVLSLSPKIVKEDVYDDYELMDEEDYDDNSASSGVPFTGSFRDLIPTQTIDGSELHFVRYKKS